LLIFIRMKKIKEMIDNMNEKQMKWAVRAFGLARLAYPPGIIIAVHKLGSPVPPPINGLLYGIGSLLAIDGIGDIITGKHHYVGVRIWSYFDERRKIRYLL